MLHAQIVGYWRGGSFDGKSFPTAKISLMLPGDYPVDVTVTESYLQQLLENQSALVEEPRAPGGDMLSVPNESTLIAWASLPDATCPARVKLAMRDHQLPAQLPSDKLAQIVATILKEYTEADWAALETKYASPRPAAPQPPNVGTVEWGEGSIMRPSVPSRTVPKNDAGWPLVSDPQREDPGEVSIPSDEDGVPEF